MRPIPLLIAACTFGLVCGIEIREAPKSGNVTTSNSTLIPDGLSVPACGLQCITDAFATSTCDDSDVPCLCTNIPLQAVLAGCVQKLCTFEQQEELARIQIGLCKGYPVPFRGGDLRLIGMILITITIPIVLLRLFSRCFIAKYVGWDDYVIFLAACLLLSISVLEIINVNNGFGRHAWYILPASLKKVLQYFWLCEMLYIITLSVTKISILLFYNRIFVSRWFLIAVRILMASIVLYAITFTMLFAFQCSPTRGFWDRTIDYKCLDTQAVIYTSAAISVFQDILILLLPIPELISLQVSVRKRFNVMVMFSVGLFALATSCIRLKYIVAFDHSKDTTWDDIPASTWSIIELNASIICACLPSLRALATRLLPSVFHSSSNNNHYYYTSNNVALKTPSCRTKNRNPSRPVADFITMPEELVEQNYREEYELRNNNNVVYYATKPLSEHEFDLARTKTEKSTPGYRTNEVYSLSQGSLSQESNPSRRALVNPGMTNRF